MSQTQTKSNNGFIQRDLKHDPFYQTLIEKLLQDKETINFVQIGAFDGTTYDELHQYVVNEPKFKGLLVEPMEKPFDELKRVYAHRTDWIFERIAVTECDEYRQVWTIPYEMKGSPDLPDWAIGCTTLLHDSNSIFGKHCTYEEKVAIQKHVQISFVTCTHLNKLLKKHSFTNVDLYHIDAEGYDWKIVKQINLEDLDNRPTVIHFEFFNLDKFEIMEIETHLNMYGYYLYVFENNYTASTIQIVHGA